MIDRTKASELTVGSLDPKNDQKMAAEKIFNSKVRQLSSLRIYYQRKIEVIDRQLALILKDDISGIDY